LALPHTLSPIARATLACVALPTCGQSLAEGERVRAPILAGIEGELDRLGLLGERISLRITGCPNGCARPTRATSAWWAGRRASTRCSSAATSPGRG
jgi:sulfite reductase beta subunit-like hemoprotein